MHVGSLDTLEDQYLLAHFYLLKKIIDKKLSLKCRLFYFCFHHFSYVVHLPLRMTIIPSKILYIERLNILETEVKQLRAENANLKNADDSLEKRVEKLEELSKFKTLRSCQELSNRGLTKSGVFDIDPDGDGIGYGPITVYCNFETNETSIYHDREDLIKVSIKT